ncbi:cytochrome C biogenesis protein CcdA [Actinoplanes sp. OR16]|uniref:cytochrome c biogenesis CcdA family protein n=1 Tax=Actinoplanes sp. OR16 TaxID=946334 RepID=UPI000F6FE464|nr:cytochrome c biogenesis CcdA family protein [Actinoplanes sp. OR16]BBH70065.1 cytochrome C biogenesis protein CcdA [Actinoplanes sp. OR16]
MFTTALAGGVLTLLSPCSAMLLPAFFSYAFTSPARLLGRTAVFYLGLITTLVPLGVLAGTAGAYVNHHRRWFVTGAAIVVILLGVLMLAAIPVPGLSRRDVQGTSAAAVYTLGTVYGLAGFCAGPLLGAVLTVAAVGGDALYGGTVLLVFALGMCLPLLVLSLLWSRLPLVRHLVRPRGIRVGPWANTWPTVLGGLLTIVVGVLLLTTDGTSSLRGLLGASDQAALESMVLRITDDVPDLLVAALALVVAAAAWLLFRTTRPSRVHRSEAPSPGVPAGTSTPGRRFRKRRRPPEQARNG